MAKYQLLKDEEGIVNRAIIKEGNDAGTSFVFIDDSSYYTAYKEWIEKGNTPDPAD
tara:strand:+ start:3139 stop:3306 length:168 start_codon:yes stop_codon:yes gene_type:complete